MKWFRKLRRWLSNTFRSNPVKKPTKTPTPVINPHLDKLRFGMIVCHTKTSQGAQSSSGKTEYYYGFRLAVGIFKDMTRVAFRNSNGVKGAAIHLRDFGKCNASFEPHKNAFNKKAEGFEVLCLKGDYLSADYALRFLTIMEKYFPNRKNRGIKYISKGRGYYNLATAKRNGMKVAILTESFFIDNDNDWIDVEKMALVWKEFLNE